MGITKKDLKDVKHLEQEINMWKEYLITVKKRSLQKVKTEKQYITVEETENIIIQMTEKLEKRRNETVKFISQIPFSHIRMGIIYHYEQGLTWRETAQRIGYISESALRTAVKRYFEGLKENQ